MSKDRIIKVGKYKRRKLSWIVQHDPEYAEWLSKKFKSNKKIQSEAQSLIDKKKNNTL